MAALPTARTAAATASSELEHAVSVCQAATAELDVARDDRTAAEQRKDRADTTVRQLTDHLVLLDGVAIPAGVDALDEKIRAAREGHQRAAAVLTAAEQADDNARTAVDTAPRRAPLDKALEDRARADRRHGGARAADGRAAERRRGARAGLGRADRGLHRPGGRSDRAGGRGRRAPGGRAAAAPERRRRLPGVRADHHDRRPPAAHAPELDAATAAVTAAQARVTTAKEAERTTGRGGRHGRRSGHRGRHDGHAAAGAAGRTAGRADGPRDAQPDSSSWPCRPARPPTPCGPPGPRRRAPSTSGSARRRRPARCGRRWGEARDPLFALGAPTLDDSDLLQAWTSLTQLGAAAGRRSAARADRRRGRRSSTRPPR